MQLYNTTNIEQHAYTPDGKRHTIAPNMVQHVDDDVALSFFEQRGKFVVEYKGIQVPQGRPGEDIVWLANATGNPFAEKKIERKKWNKKTEEYEFFKVDNPKREARTIKRRMKGRVEVRKASRADFYEQYKHPGTEIVFPPYTRHPFPKSVAKWMLRRDANQDDQARHGDITMCDAPAAFEPNDTWHRDDIYIYAAMLTEKIDWLNAFPVNKGAQGEQQKRRLLQAIFFLLIDERYQKPTKQAFEVYKAELLGEEVGESTASEQPAA